MLAKFLRLTKNDVARLYKKGQVLRKKFYIVRFTQNRADVSRFSVVVSKKVLAKATDRNSLRRKTYQIIAEIVKDSVLARNLDVSISFKVVPEENLAEEIKSTFKETGLIK